MFESVLKELGLSQNEAKIYEALLNTTSANVSSIAVKSKVHRRNVYDSLNKLVEKGLVSQLILNSEKHFKAVDPNRLMGLIKDKEELLQGELPEMEKRFQKLFSNEQAYVYKGIQGFRNYMQDILDADKDVFCIGSKDGWADKRLTLFTGRFYKEFYRKKLKVYNLFDYEMRDEIPEFVKRNKIHYKILPKGFSTNSAIDIFGDRVVTFTGLHKRRLDDDLSQFVIISNSLANSYRTWFKMIWNLLPGRKFKYDDIAN